MKAGRDLDKMIAEKVMGLKIALNDGYTVMKDLDGYEPIKPYSTDIAAAWDVVEHLGFSVIKLDLDKPQWWAGELEFDWVAEHASYTGTQKLLPMADTAPMAICLAALKTKQP